MGQSKLTSLDIRDNLILRGLGITAIVLHNFFHTVSIAHENEFTFDPRRFQYLLITLKDPALAIQGAFSFFGHYGVHIFGFLSAYGLTMKYWDNTSNWAHFVWGRIKKLYPVFGLAMIPAFVVVAAHNGLGVAAHSMGLKLIWMCLAVSNLIPGYNLPPVGPWWFIPFIIQFYALFPLLRWIGRRFSTSGLLSFSVFCIAFTYLASPILAHWSIYIATTPIAHMPEFCLGMIAARRSVRIPAPLAIISAAVVIFGNIYSALWPLTLLASLLLFLYAYSVLRPFLRKVPPIEVIGRYSLLIFLLNGIVRSYFVLFATTHVLQLFYCCISALVSFLLAFLIQEYLMPRSISAHLKPVAVSTGRNATIMPPSLKKEIALGSICFEPVAESPNQA